MHIYLQNKEDFIPLTYQTVGFMNELKEHILNISLTLFLKKGFKEVTMKEIVVKMGFSKGAFYHYFNSKEQVFAEVIEHFFSKPMSTDYQQFSKESLRAFYHGILDEYVKNQKDSAALVSDSRNDEPADNYYYLIFDAMRLLPDFKQKHLQQQKSELECWKEIANQAIEKGEIRTKLSPEVISKLFINLGDGTNLNLILGYGVSTDARELRSLWDGLYDSLRASTAK